MSPDRPPGTHRTPEEAKKIQVAKAAAEVGGIYASENADAAARIRGLEQAERIEEAVHGHMSKGTLSPDGKFIWTGGEWIPAPPVMEGAEISVHSAGDEGYKQTSTPPIAMTRTPAAISDFVEKQSDDVLRFAAITTGWNGLILIVLIFTAYSHFVKSESGALTDDSWTLVVFKGLAVAWIIGITLTVISRVKSARIHNIESNDQINFLNKTSTVLLVLPLVPIALLLIFMYLVIKYSDNGKRYY